MDFTFCLLSEQQQLLLPLEIDFALGLVLRGYLMNFGYLGKGDKGQASLGSEDKNVCVHIPFVPFFDSVFLEPSQKQLERRRELEADKVGLQKPQKKKKKTTILTLYRLYSPNKPIHVRMTEKPQCFKR